MLNTASEPANGADADREFAELRASQFSRLDRTGTAYLDYTGSALHPECLLRAHAARLDGEVLGNPHSEHEPSRRSAALIEDARTAVLTFFNADPAVYTVCFTANATSAIKLVGDAYPFGKSRGLLLSADNHNSVNGIRELARRAGAPVRYVDLDADLRLRDPDAALDAASREMTGGLFAFPAQSNFSGVQHDLELVARAHRRGFAVLLDAAAFVPTNVLDLRAHAPDFVVLSFYKMFGYPTGIGALIARRDSLADLRRPSFAGGAVDFVSVQNDMHQLTQGARGFEDGTPDFLGICAVRDGLAFLQRIGVARIHDHVARLTTSLLDAFRRLEHHNGCPVARVYGPRAMRGRGGTVAFTVVGPNGDPTSYSLVETRARELGVALRGGCFCNPGCAESAFGFSAGRAREAMLAAAREGFTIERFAAHMGRGVAVGAMRASLGMANNVRDIERAVAVVASFAD